MFQLLALLGALVAPVTPPKLAATAENPLGMPIEHIVVLYMENRSFDGLYGNFPGANGIERAGNAAIQVDRSDRPYTTLPPILHDRQIDSRFPTNLPNRPFEIGQYAPLNTKTGDLVHRYYQEQQQINNGKMDRFVAAGDAGGLAMGYYNTSGLKLYKYAQQYTLNDNFFHSAFGGSFLNHLFLIAAAPPVWYSSPDEAIVKLDDRGNLIKDGLVTPDYYAVNTTQPTAIPFKVGTPISHRLPPQTLATIGDRLSDKNISWAWYSGGWNRAIALNPDPLFQYHHQPFAYFAKYGTNTPDRAAHLKDETDFIQAIETDTLPAVAFVKPSGADNQHPGYADIATGDEWAARIIDKIQHRPAWNRTAIIVTYDENGGMWDSVAPPKIDRWGVGTRVPTIVISPYAKRGFIDHTQLETVSILKFIETRFNLEPLTERDRNANNLLNSFDFVNTPVTKAVPF